MTNLQDIINVNHNITKPKTNQYSTLEEVFVKNKIQRIKVKDIHNQLFRFVDFKEIVAILIENNYLIVGGDLIIQNGKKFEYSYDNWSIIDGDNLNISNQKALEFEKQVQSRSKLLDLELLYIDFVIKPLHG